ncbi:MAG: hypothetical protein LKE89_04290 [Lactobacillaceae bacterium]|jgi:uncharacterized membrane protein YhaH (DUF805 family)|nr:hypothetical protein [Lactobacillaceae bacterium]
MLLKNFFSKKKNILVTAFIALAFIFSQFTFAIPTSHAAGGAAKIFIIELFIIALGIYVVLWRLLIKGELKIASLWTKYYFILAIIFAVFYLATFVYRIFNHMSLVSSFLLARIIIEVCIVAISLDFLKINFQSIFTGLLVGNFVSVLTQFAIVLWGVGEIRTGNHNLLGNSITSYICMIMFYPVLIYCLSNHRNPLIYRILSTLLIILSIPTLIYSGSRIALSVGLFILVLSAVVMLIIHLMTAKSFWKFIGWIAGTTIIFLFLIGLFSSPTNKQNLIRSVDVPTSLYNRVVPDAAQIDLYGLVNPDQGVRKKHKKKKDLQKAEESIKLSNYMRVIINDKAKKKIFTNPRNLLFGIGMSSIYTDNWGYQKPHNLFLLYLLPFGLIGTIISYLILFGPLIFMLTRRIQSTKVNWALLLLTYFPIILISWHQPTLGTLITCLSMLTITFSESPLVNRDTTMKINIK